MPENFNKFDLSNKTVEKRKKILFCPLDWGLGHASRDIPIIDLLKENNFDIYIAGSFKILDFLKKEVSGAKFIEFGNYKVKYSRQNSQVINMFFLIPKIIYWTIKEHFILKRLIKKYDIDIVISDNRFGLWNKRIISIFITHQLKVIFPKRYRKLEFIYESLLRFIINKYDDCWVPDYKGIDNLSGELSHLNHNTQNISYIGLLSRFSKLKDDNSTSKVYDILVILSGPEPQRSLFEEIIYSQIERSNLKIAIVRGTLEKSILSYSVQKFDLLNTGELNQLMDISEVVICRSGYSSVMDLIVKKKKAILVPTPGQTEQEYLAEYLSQKGLYEFIIQEKFKLDNINISEINQPNFQIEKKEKLLLRAITDLEK